MAARAQIIGWGSYLPSRIVTNHDLAKLVETSDDWIRERTGIVERRIAQPRETTAEMAIHAAQAALKSADADPADIDMIIVATTTPDRAFPSTACIVQDALGARHASAFDLSAACSGFVYGLAMASASIATDTVKLALVVGAEKLSGIVDWTDRSTCILFGDGAGAILLRGEEGPAGILATALGADGSGAEALALNPKEAADPDDRGPYIVMNGRHVFRFATRAMASAVRQVVDEAGLKLTDLKLIIPHQANQRIIESACANLNFPLERVFTNLERYGNTSAASIPIALCEVAESGTLSDGDLIALVAFGAGLTWAAALVRWGRLEKPTWYKAFRARVRQIWAAFLWQRRRVWRRLQPLLQHFLRR